MFFAFSFVPVFQDHEIGPCVREFAATHDRETVYSDIGLDFRIAVEDLVDLLSDCFRTVQAGCRRELGGYQEITVILFRDESGRPTHKHDDGNGRYDPEYHHRDKRVLQHAADDVVIYFLGFAEHLVEGFEYKEFRFFVRLQEQGAQAGVSVSELNPLKTVAAAIVRANCLYNWPEIPLMKVVGIKTASNTSTTLRSGRQFHP